MNKKLITIVLLAVVAVTCLIGLVACIEKANDDNVDKQYTIIWKNDNGETLKTEKVKEGNIPAYDGETPVKDKDEQYSYVFAGWEPAVSAARADAVYTAKYTSSVNKYTVTWKNDNGEVLKSEEFSYGAMPNYDGTAPCKANSGGISYVFAGWTPSPINVTGNATYTAKFIERNDDDLIAGVDIVFSEDNKTAQYGFYPQTHVSDEALISALSALSPSETNGWYFYNGEYYAKETAKVYKNESYTFDDGTPIIDGNEYWFKCEVIVWQVLSEADGKYCLLSDKLLDAHNFYADYSNRNIDGATVYANNYAQSDIRTWLNGEFYNTAFALGGAHIKETVVDNSSATTEAMQNPYACANTKDKVYLPSYRDYLNSDYGFDANAAETSASRECKTTDYARARGAWYNTQTNLKYNGSYWTRSPSSEYYYCAWNVNSGGLLSAYAVDGSSHCVRPCITVYF